MVARTRANIGQGVGGGVRGAKGRDDADGVRNKEIPEKRLALYGLTLYPGKTRLIEFGRFAHANRQARGLGKPDTFDLLDRSATSRINGWFVLCRHSISTRIRTLSRNSLRASPGPSHVKAAGYAASFVGTSNTTAYRATSPHWTRCATRSGGCGYASCVGVVRKTR